MKKLGFVEGHRDFIKQPYIVYFCNVGIEMKTKQLSRDDVIFPIWRGDFQTFQRELCF